MQCTKLLTMQMICKGFDHVPVQDGLQERCRGAGDFKFLWSPARTCLPASCRMQVTELLTMQMSQKCSTASISSTMPAALLVDLSTQAPGAAPASLTHHLLASEQAAFVNCDDCCCTVLLQPCRRYNTSCVKAASPAPLTCRSPFNKACIRASSSALAACACTDASFPMAAVRHCLINEQITKVVAMIPLLAVFRPLSIGTDSAVA